MSLSFSANGPNESSNYFLLSDQVPVGPIPGPQGPVGPVGPQGAQGVPGGDAFGTWYYDVVNPPIAQNLFIGATIVMSLTPVLNGGAQFLNALQNQFLTTGSASLYLTQAQGTFGKVQFGVNITGMNFFDALGYVVINYVALTPLPAPGAWAVGQEVVAFYGGGTVGPQGPPGPAGAAGTAATIVVGATNTLAPGSAATVVNSGTANAAILDFGIPEGQPGPPGPPGPPDWSNYPAVSNVDAAGFNITNTGTLGSVNIDCYQTAITGFGALQVGSPILAAPNPGTVNVNGTLTVQRGTANFYANALGVEFDGQSVVPAANSVKFGAIPVGGINTCRMELNTLTAPAAIQLVAPSFITIDAGGAANITAAGAALVQAGGITTIESAAKDIRLQGTGGTFSDVSMFGGTLGGMGNITGQAGSGVAIGNVNAIGGVGSNMIAITSDLSGAAGVDYITRGDVISSNGLSTQTSLNAVGALTRFRDNTTFYVSNSGSPSGDGSILNPFQTIQAAINAAEAISSAALLGVINVASGHYNENLTFNKGYVMLNGELSTQTANEVVEINGSITISCAGAADLFNRQVIIQGFNITCILGQTITDNSTTSHAVSFQDCKIATVGRAFNGISTGADARTYFTNCEILQTNAATTDSTIFINRGGVEIERVDITTDGNAPCLEIAGNASVFRCSLSTFENTNVSATVAPICLITTSSLSAQPFGQCTFTYTSAVSKAASPTSSAIRIASGVNTTLILLNNYYTMTGLIGSGNNVITYNAVGSPTVLLNENRSLYIPGVAPNTFSIQSGITKVNYTDMNGPAAGSYSSSAIQGIGLAAVALTLNTTEKQFNTSLAASSRIYTAATGTFRFDYSVQLENTSGGDQTVKIWIQKGTGAGASVAVPRSASQVIVSNNGQTFPFCSYTIDMAAGDFLEVYAISTSAANVRALAVAAAAPVPAVPSIIVNLTQVGS